MIEIRDDRKYTKTHQWAKEENGRVLVGITDYAQRALRAVVFVNLPEEGDTLTAGEPLGEVESTKVVAEVISPVSGTVSRINEGLLDDPTVVNVTPYDAWFVEVDTTMKSEELLDPEEYRTLVESMKK